MLTKFKKRVQQILTSEAEVAHKMGLTPNIISIIGGIFAFLSAIIYAKSQNILFYLLLATALLLISGFCDVLDGVLARHFQEETVFGSFLDSIIDRYAEAVVYMGIIIGELCDTLFGIIAITGSLLVSYSRAKGELNGIKMESIGLLERAERIIILASASIASIFWLPALNIGVILLAILSNLTVLQRGLHIYGKLKK